MRFSLPPLSRRSTRIALLALAGGLIFHLGAFTLFSVRLGGLQAPRESKPFISLAGLDFSASEVLRQQAALQDSSPLFLPTSWNIAATSFDLSELVAEPDIFSSFEEEITASENAFRGSRERIKQVAPPPAVSVGEPRMLSLFGRSQLPLDPLPPRHGAWLATNLLDGNSSYGGDIQSIEDLAGTPLFEPTTFLVRTTPAGPLGEPLLIKGAGNDNIEAALARYIQTRIAPRLPPGYFQVTIGP